MSWRRRARRLTTGAMLAATSVVVTLALAELTLQLIGYRVVLDHGWVLTSPAQRIDPSVGLIDRRFLDDASYRLARPEAPVVAALGDSFTAGFGVEPAQSYPAVLERMLLARGTPANVLNLGLGDSGPDRQLRLFLDRVLPRVAPDLVIWCFYANDLADNVRIPAYDIEDGRLVPLDGTRSWIARRQRLYGALPLPETLKARSVLLKLLLAVPGRMQLRAIDRAGREAHYERALDKIRLAVEELRRVGAERGFGVRLFYVRPQADYLAPGEGAWQDEASVEQRVRLAELLERMGGTVIDFGDASAKSVFLGGNVDPNARGGRHFNAEGYRRMARFIAERIALPAAGYATSGH